MSVANITYSGILDSDSSMTVGLDDGITVADCGKALAFNSATSRFRLAKTGDILRGRLDVVEDRGNNGGLVGTMITRGGLTFLKDAGDTILPGAGITCLDANPGLVTTAAPAVGRLVTTVGTNYATVLFNV